MPKLRLNEHIDNVRQICQHIEYAFSIIAARLCCLILIFRFGNLVLKHIGTGHINYGVKGAFLKLKAKI